MAITFEGAVKLLSVLHKCNTLRNSAKSCNGKCLACKYYLSEKSISLATNKFVEKLNEE